MGIFDRFVKKSRDNAVKKEEFKVRREYIKNRHFCDRFTEELKQFHTLGMLQVNPYIPEEDLSFEISEAIPLISFSNESIGRMDYEEFLLENEKEIWEEILVDDSIECLADDIVSQYPNGCDLFIAFTNDCSAMNGYQGMFGLYITYGR